MAINSLLHKIDLQIPVKFNKFKNPLKNALINDQKSLHKLNRTLPHIRLTKISLINKLKDH